MQSSYCKPMSYIYCWLQQHWKSVYITIFFSYSNQLDSINRPNSICMCLVRKTFFSIIEVRLRSNAEKVYWQVLAWLPVNNYGKIKKRTTCLSMFHIQAMRKTLQNPWPFWRSAKDLSSETLLDVLVLSV